jgi:hypothetical protein
MTIRPLAALCLLAAVPSARAGVVMEMKTGQDTEKPTLMYLDGDRLRIEQDDGEGKARAVMIFDAATRTMTHVDPATRTYYQVTADDVRKMVSGAKAKSREAIAKARAQLDKMPAEQRKQVEAALAQAEAQAAATPAEKKPPRPLRLRFEKLGKSGSAAGHSCDWYRQFDGDQDDGEGCFTPLPRLGLKVDDFKPFEAIVQVFDTGDGGGRDRLDFAKVLAQAPGFPIIAAQVEDGKRRETMRLVRISRESIAASTFAVPSGYKRVAMPGMGGPGAKGDDD